MTTTVQTLRVTALNTLTIVEDHRHLSPMLSSTANLLLIYLLTTVQPYRREALAELFWPDRQGKQAASNLRTLLTELRRTCGHHLVITRTTVAVDLTNIHYDVAAFHTHITAAQTAIQNSTPKLAVPHWEAALHLHQRPFLCSFREPASPELQLWLTLERELRYYQMLGALRQLVTHYTTEGSYAAALPFAQRWLTLEPLDIEAVQALLRLLAETGETAAALTHYRRFRQAYQRETGRQPESAELDALVKTITVARYHGKALSTAATDNPPKPTPSTKRHNDNSSIRYLSAGPPGMVYGRSTQIERIVNKLRNATDRLVSLVGMGGVGKTVLAQAIGTQLQQTFQAGVCFVPLVDVPAESTITATQQQVALAITTALGLMVRDDDELVAALVAHLQPLTLLLVLDNCEHLEGIAPFLGELLQNAPQLRLLVTSRVRLNLSNERVETVDTLPLPPTPPSLATMVENPAVQLFLARAERQLATFTLDADNMAAIHRICYAVGGLPLALEMAAYWITLYTPQEIADTIAHEGDFLTCQTNDGPQRQRSIAEVFDYSWQLLSPAEQQVLTTLCLFQNSFDRQAALTVAACTTRELGTLIHCALLDVKSPGIYALHPLVKTFAAARSSVMQEATERYIAHFFAMLPSNDATASPSNQSTTDFSVQQAADLAYAWALAVEQQDDARLVQVLPRFSYFWWIIGRPRTGIRLLRRLQERLEYTEHPTATQQQLLGATLHQTMRLAHILMADLATALADGERALVLLREFGPLHTKGHMLLDLGNLYVSQERATEAEPLVEQALIIAEETHSLQLQIGATVVLSRIAWARGNWEVAAAYCQKALAAVTTTGEEPPETTDLLWEMFNQSLLRHDFESAEALYQRACAWGNQHKTESNQRQQLREMAFSLTLVQGRWHDAHALAQARLATTVEQDNPQAYCAALAALAITTLHIDTATSAHQIAEQALAIATTAPLTSGTFHAHLVLGMTKAALGQAVDAGRHFRMVLEKALTCQGELYALRNLFGSLLQLAKLERAKLPPALFVHVIATVATQPQGALLTRTEAVRLAEHESIDLTAAKEQARRAVDWASLAALARLVQQYIDAK